MIRPEYLMDKHEKTLHEIEIAIDTQIKVFGSKHFFSQFSNTGLPGPGIFYIDDELYGGIDDDIRDEICRRYKSVGWKYAYYNIEEFRYVQNYGIHQRLSTPRTIIILSMTEPRDKLINNFHKVED